VNRKRVEGFVSRLLLVSLLTSLLCLPLGIKKAEAEGLQWPVDAALSVTEATYEGNSYLDLSWPAFMGGTVENYRVYEKDGESSEYLINSTPAATTTYRVGKPTTPMTYTFSIAVVIGGTELPVRLTSTWTLSPSDISKPYWNYPALYTSNQSSTGVTLHWDPAVDNVGVTQYRVSWAENPTGIVTSDTYLAITGLTPNNAYLFDIVAGDASGNWSIPVTISVTAEEVTVVSFADPDLEAEVRYELGKYYGDITSADMAELSELGISYSNIDSLAGLEYAVNLKSLIAYGNQITDLSPLEDLVLDYLDVEINLLTDISVLRTIYDNGGFQTSDYHPDIWIEDNPTLRLDVGTDNRAVLDDLLGKGVSIYHDELPLFVGEADAYLTNDGGYTEVGDEFTVTVNASDVPNLYGYQFELDYDNNAFEVVGVQPNPEFASEIMPEYAEGSYAFMHTTTASGNLRVVASLKGPEQGVDLDGTGVALADVTFKAIAVPDSTEFRIPMAKTVFADGYGTKYTLAADVIRTLGPDVPVTAVEIDYFDYEDGDKGAVRLFMDDVGYPLEYTVSPSNATDQTVTWSSSNPSVLTVDAVTGYMTPVAPGSAEVTVTTRDGGYSDKVKVYVLAEGTPFAMTPSKGLVGINEFVKITVTKSTYDHDMTQFNAIFSADPSVWEIAGIVPAEDIAGKMSFDVANVGYFGYAVTGDVYGESLVGAQDLFTVYLKNVGDDHGEEPEMSLSSLDASSPYEYPSYGLFYSEVKDSSGIMYGSYEMSLSHVPVIDPDIDGYEGVEVTDLVKIAKLYGTQVDWVSGEDGDWVWTPNHDLDFNRDGWIGLDELTFIHLRIVFEGYDPDAPTFELPPLPEYDYEDDRYPPYPIPGPIPV